MEHTRQRDDGAAARSPQQAHSAYSLGTLRSRRALVGVTVALGLASVALFWQGAFAAPLVGAAALAAGWLVHRGARQATSSLDPVLAAHLAETRHTSYRSAYMAVGAITALALLALTVATNAAWAQLTLEGPHLRAMFWGFVLMAVLAPSTLLAWQEHPR